MKALGVMETRGMAALVSGVDAMLKAADVELSGRHGVGSGWVTAVVAGEVEAVRRAVQAGTENALPYGELVRKEILPHPEPFAFEAMPHELASAEPPEDNRALGMLETQGLTPLLVGADAAAKAADVELSGWAFIGGALCHGVVRGDVSAVRTAVQEGRRAAEAVGTVYATLVIPRPSRGVALLLPCERPSEPARGGALGVLETTGYVACVAGADAMVKAAEVFLCRFSIGSGGRIVALVMGNVEDVVAAVKAGSAASQRVGGFVAAEVVSHCDSQVAACFAGAFQGRISPSGEAIGLLETRSTVGLVKAMDKMLKTANVAFEGNYKVGYFLTASVIRGEVSAVRTALEVGAQEAIKYGDLVGVHLIPHPYSALEERMPHR